MDLNIKDLFKESTPREHEERLIHIKKLFTNETERNNAKKDLKTMKTLGEVVKVKKPKDIKEHIFNINSDIKKVFENDKISGKKDAKMIIPTEYKLYQIQVSQVLYDQ